MDVLPSGGIFRELQVVHDTGYFSGQASLEEDWHQVYLPLLNNNTEIHLKFQSRIPAGKTLSSPTLRQNGQTSRTYLYITHSLHSYIFAISITHASILRSTYVCTSA